MYTHINRETKIQICNRKLKPTITCCEQEYIRASYSTLLVVKELPTSVDVTHVKFLESLFNVGSNV